MSGEPPVHGQPLHGRLWPGPAAMPSRLKPGNRDGSPLRDGWSEVNRARPSARRGRAAALAGAASIAPPARSRDGAPVVCIPTPRRGARTSRSSSAGDTAGLDVSGWAPRGSDGSGRLWEPTAPDGGDGAAGSPATQEASWPDGQAPQRAVMTVTDRNPAPVTPPAPRAQRRLPLWGRCQADWQPTQARAVPGGCLRCAAGRAR